MAVAFSSFTGHGDTNPTTSCTVTLPTTAANDILILQVINGGANAAPTGPGGTYVTTDGGSWTAIGTGSGWTSGWGGVWWTRCSGNHATRTVTFTGATDSISAGVTRFTGCHTSGNPYDTNISEATVAAGANCALAAFDTTVYATLVVYCVAIDDNLTSSSPTKGGSAMGNLSQKVSGGGADSGVHNASLAQSGTGTTGSFSLTVAAGTNQGKRATAFALKPPIVTNTEGTKTGTISLTGTKTESYGKTFTEGTKTGTITVTGTRTESWSHATIYTEGVRSGTISLTGSKTEASGRTARYFDGSDDLLTTSIGGANLTGAYTIAALVKRVTDNAAAAYVTNFTSAPANGVGIGTNASNQVFVAQAATVRNAAGLTFTVSDGWVIIVATKASGTATPRLHLYKGGSWSHADAASTLGNPSSQSEVRFGSYILDGLFTASNIALAAEWISALSDAQIETLDNNSQTQDWGNLSPAAMWEFGGSVATPLDDLIDGADQSAITGTSAIATGPTWTYGYTPATIYTDAPTGTLTLTGSRTEGKVYGEGTRTGTVTLTGTRTEAKAHSGTVTGTVTLTGTRTESNARSESRTGIIALTGTRAEAKIHSQSVTGTVTLTGTRTESWGKAYIDAVTGTIPLSGSAVEALSAADAVTGHLLPTGSVVESLTFTDTRTGTVPLAGTRTESNARSESRTGTVTLTGSVLESYITESGYYDAPVGTLVLAGTRTESNARSESCAGTITLTGTRTESRVHSCGVRTGTITLTGSRTESKSHSATRSGTIPLSGTRTESYQQASTFNDAPTGTIRLSGTRTAAHIHSGSVTGTVPLTGTRTEFRGYADLVSGRVTLTGSSSEFKSHAVSVSAVLPLTGSAVESFISLWHDEFPVGTLRLVGHNRREWQGTWRLADGGTYGPGDGSTYGLDDDATYSPDDDSTFALAGGATYDEEF